MSRMEVKKKLWQELDRELIFPKLIVRDRDDVLKKMGDIMIMKGYTKKGYVRALQQRERTFPTGILIGENGVAIPHTESNQVIKEGVAIGILKKPVSFGLMEMENDKILVSIVVMLAVKENGKHIELLQRILKMLQDKEFLQDMKNASDTSQIISLMKKKEESL